MAQSIADIATSDLVAELIRRGVVQCAVKQITIPADIVANAKATAMADLEAYYTQSALREIASSLAMACGIRRRPVPDVPGPARGCKGNGLEITLAVIDPAPVEEALRRRADAREKTLAMIEQHRVTVEMEPRVWPLPFRPSDA